tara:strand:- start:91 stop:510 length:420 start_codon:yes stop_codon:yes gene_type:complete
MKLIMENWKHFLAENEMLQKFITKRATNAQKAGFKAVKGLGKIKDGLRGDHYYVGYEFYVITKKGTFVLILDKGFRGPPMYYGPSTKPDPRRKQDSHYYGRFFMEDGYENDIVGKNIDLNDYSNTFSGAQILWAGFKPN